MYRDYGKNVRFYFIYKSLAHPEHAGGYLQPFTLEERLTHAREAKRRLGATIPWLVDAMDNRLKHALGNRPNSEFVLDPDGKVVRKRAWSNPVALRKDLETLLGPSEKTTRPEDIKLRFVPPPKVPAQLGVVPRVPRKGMQALTAKPGPSRSPFLAKLRAEGSPSLIRTGQGQLYLGFHLDPLHGAHWNNLAPPLSYELRIGDVVEVKPTRGTAPKVEVTSDADPREFLIRVKSWPKDEPIRVVVRYAACIGSEVCQVISQEYVLHRSRDRDAGGAKSVGAGLWDAREFANRMLAGDTDGDGQLSRSETAGIILPHFDKLDANKDEYLTRDELLVVAEWLNNPEGVGSSKN